MKREYTRRYEGDDKLRVSCSDCGLLKTANSLVGHRLYEHPKTMKKAQVFICPYCLAIFRLSMAQFYRKHVDRDCIVLKVQNL